MKMNLRNELWKSNPHDAKLAFEKELREIMSKTPNNRPDLAVVYIKDILGEACGTVNKNKET